MPPTASAWKRTEPNQPKRRNDDDVAGDDASLQAGGRFHVAPPPGSSESHAPGAAWLPNGSWLSRSRPLSGPGPFSCHVRKRPGPTFRAWAMSSFPRRRQLRPGCTSGLTGRDGCRAARLVGGGRQARKQSRARGSQVWAVGAESPPLTPTWRVFFIFIFFKFFLQKYIFGFRFYSSIPLPPDRGRTSTARQGGGRGPTAQQEVVGTYI